MEMIAASTVVHVSSPNLVNHDNPYNQKNILLHKMMYPLAVFLIPAVYQRIYRQRTTIRLFQNQQASHLFRIWR